MPRLEPAGKQSLFLCVIRAETFPGLLLVAAAAAALAISNSPWASAWHDLFETTLTLRLGGQQLSKSVLHWINDGLMVLFFFFIGLELKHEILDGQLRSVRAAALPIAAAVGGMAVPALFYFVVVAAHGDAGAAAGWGIPMATDIAFALGVLALLGKRVPPALKVFLATLAIVDDLGAVLVIALFYTDAIAWRYLDAGLLLVGLSYGLNRIGVRSTWPYALLGIGIWLLFLKSGVHATIAGVALAMTVPARRQLDEKLFSARGRQLLDEFDRVADPTPGTNAEQLELVHELAQHCSDVQAPLQRMEHSLEPFIAFLIVPLFALSNAGVGVVDGFGSNLHAAAAQGVFVGLLLGKPLGVYGSTRLAARLLRSDLPPGLSWRHVHGAAWLAGIGFTMSLFVNSLALAAQPAALDAAKIAVLAASLAGGSIGCVLLWRAARP